MGQQPPQLLQHRVQDEHEHPVPQLQPKIEVNKQPKILEQVNDLHEIRRCCLPTFPLSIRNFCSDHQIPNRSESDHIHPSQPNATKIAENERDAAAHRVLAVPGTGAHHADDEAAAGS